jgi:hypothetical protein
MRAASMQPGGGGDSSVHESWRSRRWATRIRGHVLVESTMPDSCSKKCLAMIYSSVNLRWHIMLLTDPKFISAFFGFSREISFSNQAI